MTYKSKDSSVLESDQVATLIVVTLVPMRSLRSSMKLTSTTSNERCYSTLPLWILIGYWVKILISSRKTSVISKSLILYIDACNRLDFLCKNYILHGLINSLYKVYYTDSSTKNLWESLDQKYKTKDIRAKKLIMCPFLAYKTVDSKIEVSQVKNLKWFSMRYMPRKWHWVKTSK